MSKRISLGIDLGTTNSAIALTDLESDRTEVPEITQIIRPNQIAEKPTLPSALYIPHRDEFPANSFPLPWDDAVGETVVAAQPGHQVVEGAGQRRQRRRALEGRLAAAEHGRLRSGAPPATVFAGLDRPTGPTRGRR